MGISTRNPDTGRPELTLVASVGFDLDAATRSLTAAMSPPDRAQLAKWLATLSAITASRSRDDLDAGLIMAIYSERLSAFPADVVEHVLLRERWRWFPPIADLEEACERHTSRRRTIAALLAQGRIRCGHKPQKVHQTDRGPAATKEARERIMAEVWPDRPAVDLAGPFQRAAEAEHRADGD